MQKFLIYKMYKIYCPGQQMQIYIYIYIYIYKQYLVIYSYKGAYRPCEVEKYKGYKIP